MKSDLSGEFEKRRVLTKILNESNESILSLIKTIQEKTGRKLVVYITNFTHPLGAIHLMDIIPFEEIVRTITTTSGLARALVHP